MRATCVVVCLLVASVGGCGGEVGGTVAPSDAAAAPDGADAADAATACAADMDAGVSDAGPHTGAVVASWSDGRELLSAGFPYFGGFALATSGTTCNCVAGLPLPTPSASAGTVTVQAAHCGALLASLAFEDEAGFAKYAQASATWTPGDALSVSAPGVPSQVHAFAGTLQTVAPLTGLSPAVGPGATVTLPLAHPLVVSWTPEGRSGETVVFGLSEVGASGIVACSCVAPDSAGTLTVPASVMARFVATTATTTATATASRTLDTPASADNAVVHLVGVAATGGAVALQ